MFNITSSQPERQLSDAEWKSRASFAYEKNVADKLTGVAKSKFLALRAECDDARAVRSVPYQKMKEVRDRIDQVQLQISQLTREGARPYRDDHPAVVAEQEVLDKLRAEMRELLQEDDRRKAASAAIEELAKRLDAYVDALPPGVTLAPATVPKLLKGEAAVTALTRIRDRVQALQDDIQAAIDAPVTSADVKKKMRAQVAALAERGRPDVGPAIDFGEQIRFAMTPASVFVAGPGGQARGNAEVFDAAGAFAWLFEDALVKKLDAEIDAAADDTNALTDQDRKARIAAAKKELLEVERQEEALIEAAKATGLTIQRRANADPRAILQLADSAPAPRDD